MGFTLIEILCVMGIIAIMAGLLLGPVARVLKRARAMDWGQKAEIQLQLTLAQLQKHFQGKQDFPPVTMEQLETRKLVGPDQLRFLKDKRVTYIPFAGTDPDDKPVIFVKLESGFLTEGGVLMEVKGRITLPPE